MRLRLLLIIALMGCLQYWFFTTDTAVVSTAILTDYPVQTDKTLSVQQVPIQKAIQQAHSYSFQGYQITPQAQFQVAARVLSRKDYSTGRESELSGIDLALGWAEMSNPDILAQIKIHQSGRFYFWSVESFPIPRQVIEINSANMHLIAATDSVQQALNTIRASEFVRLTGYLVNVDANDGWRWHSSLTRTDTGNGACELFLVAQVEKL